MTKTKQMIIRRGERDESQGKAISINSEKIEFLSFLSDFREKEKKFRENFLIIFLYTTTATIC